MCGLWATGIWSEHPTSGNGQVGTHCIETFTEMYGILPGKPSVTVLTDTEDPLSVHSTQQTDFSGLLSEKKTLLPFTESYSSYFSYVIRMHLILDCSRDQHCFCLPEVLSNVFKYDHGRLLWTVRCDCWTYVLGIV